MADITLTDAEEKILADADSVEEMLRSGGWQLLEKRLRAGLEQIKASKATIAVSDWKQDSTTGQIVFDGDIDFEEIGRQYMRLEERRVAFEGVLGEPQVIIRQAAAIRKKLAEPAAQETT